MHVDLLVWVVSLGIATAVLVVDVAVVGRRPHVPTTAECLRYLGLYVGLAIAFGVAVGFLSGGRYAGEFFAGWLTEYSLSVDNLFVFMLIMARFAVPRAYQQTALMIGIVLALLFRGIFIVAGSAVVETFSWVFYLFGAFLVWTAWKVGREGAGGGDGEDEFSPPLLLRLVQRWLPATEEYHGVRLTVVQQGRRLVTPMLIVLVALGATDLLFAFDSIPAIFGLTSEPYLIIMANIFALMGLRQLYFLLGGLLDRLVYLSYGLAVLLGFIGVKLVLEALHTNEVPFINGGEPVAWAPEIPIWLSLVSIVVILGVTAIASLVASRGSRVATAVDGAVPEPPPGDDVPPLRPADEARRGSADAA